MFPSLLLAPARRSCHGSSGAPSSPAWGLPNSRFAPGFASSLCFKLQEVLFAVSRVQLVRWDHEPRGLLQPKSQWSWELQVVGFWGVGCSGSASWVHPIPWDLQCPPAPQGSPKATSNCSWPAETADRQLFAPCLVCKQSCCAGSWAVFHGRDEP